jgi:hypothetical protein
LPNPPCTSGRRPTPSEARPRSRLAEPKRTTEPRGHYSNRLEELKGRPPRPPALPTTAWINKPTTEEVTHETRPPPVSLDLTGVGRERPLQTRGLALYLLLFVASMLVALELHSWALAMVLLGTGLAVLFGSIIVAGRQGRL